MSTRVRRHMTPTLTLASTGNGHQAMSTSLRRVSTSRHQEGTRWTITSHWAPSMESPPPEGMDQRHCATLGHSSRPSLTMTLSTCWDLTTTILSTSSQSTQQSSILNNRQTKLVPNKKLRLVTNCGEHCPTHRGNTKVSPSLCSPWTLEQRTSTPAILVTITCALTISLTLNIWICSEDATWRSAEAL